MSRFNLASIQLQILWKSNQVVQIALCRLKVKESKKIALIHEYQESTKPTTNAVQTPLQLKPRKNTLESLVESKVSNSVLVEVNQSYISSQLLHFNYVPTLQHDTALQKRCYNHSRAHFGFRRCMKKQPLCWRSCTILDTARRDYHTNEPNGA